MSGEEEDLTESTKRTKLRIKDDVHSDCRDESCECGRFITQIAMINSNPNKSLTSEKLEELISKVESIDTNSTSEEYNIKLGTVQEMMKHLSNVKEKYGIENMLNESAVLAASLFYGSLSESTDDVLSLKDDNKYYLLNAEPNQKIR